MPTPLAAILAAAMLIGIAWTFVTPAWQSPDENSHFGYTQYLAETGGLPGKHPNAPLFSTEQNQAASDSNADQAASQLSTKMSWSKSAFDNWRVTERKLGDAKRGDAGGLNPASSNPPLYYVFETPAYLIGSHGDIFTRLELMRLASLIWLLVTIVGAWLLAGEIFGKDRLLQLGVAGLVGLAPMVQFVSSSVTPDSMLFASWSITMWLGVRLLRRGPTTVGVAAFFGVVGAACVVKATSYALAPAAVFVLLLALWRSREHVVASLATAFGGVAGTLGVWAVGSRLSGHAAAAQVSAVAGGGKLDVRQFVDYVWQYYLPRLPFMTKFPRYPTIVPHLGLYDILFKGTTAGFGWLEIKYSDPFYLVLAALALIVLVAAGASLWSIRRQLDWGVGFFFVLLLVGLLVGLHVSEYRQLTTGAVNFIQGRYLLPLAPIAAIAAMRALVWVPVRWRAAAVASALGALLVFNLFSMGLVLERFYA